MISVDDLITEILEKEGGYVNHPADKGGPTNYGITLATLKSYRRGHNVEEKDVRDLTEEEARDIYEEIYYFKPQIDLLPIGVQPFALDCAVNHGPSRAIKFLQQVCTNLGHKLVQDGINGPRTSATVGVVYKTSPSVFINQLVETRKTFYQMLVDRDPAQAVFLKGWLRRADSFSV